MKKLLRINKDGLDSLNVGLLSHSLHSSSLRRWGNGPSAQVNRWGFFCLVFNLDRNVLCNIPAFGKTVFSATRAVGISETFLQKNYRFAAEHQPAAQKVQFTSRGIRLSMSSSFAVLVLWKFQGTFVLFLLPGWGRGVLN